MVDGEFDELQTFLVTMGYRLNMDQIQQNAERLYRKDPTALQEMLRNKDQWKGGVLQIDQSVKGDWLVKSL